MTIQEVNDYADMIDEEIIVFSSPSFENAIIGISNDNRVIYDYDLMIEDLLKDEDMTYENAVEFLDYNTLCAHYIKDRDPIILMHK